MSNKKLSEIYLEWSETVGIKPGAVFYDLKTIATAGSFVLPWGNDETVATMLDTEYIGNVSGDKIVSPLVQKLLDRSYSMENVRLRVARILKSLFLDKWQKAYNTLSFEYNPIENYSMLEQLSGDQRKRYYGKSNTRTDNLTSRNAGSDVNARVDDLTSRNAGTTRSDPNLSDTEQVNVYGFNTSDANGEPSEKRTKSQTGSKVDTVDVSTTNTGSQTNTETVDMSRIDTGTQTFVDGGSDREEHEYTLTRTGNIGTVTAQDMIEQERAIVLWDYFFTVVFPDIDRIMTIPIY